MENLRLREAAPTSVNVTVGKRSREYLTDREARHSRHPSLSRPPIDHVHGSLHGLDAEPVQKLLEGLNFPSVSYQTQEEQRRS
jgi:hypothetical protein